MSKGFTILSCYIGFFFWNYHGQTWKQGAIREACTTITSANMWNTMWCHGTSHFELTTRVGRSKKIQTLSTSSGQPLFDQIL
jgi:hypothetical protein